MKNGFLRASTAVPEIRVADCMGNAAAIIALAKEADAQQARLVVFPELCVTGYTCGDLFLQQTLLDGAVAALDCIRQATGSLSCLTVVGLPLTEGACVYNCAAVLYRGEVLGIVPKMHLPNYGEFYEMRQFTPGPAHGSLQLFGRQVPFGGQMLFRCENMPLFTLGVEICEDLWVPEPPSGKLCAHGATVMANLSASNETAGKAEYRRLLVQSQSARSVSAYLYADAGAGESTTDLVFAGHCLLYENGKRLAESQRFATGVTFADLDLERLAAERRRLTTFRGEAGEETVVPFVMEPTALSLCRTVEPHPFVPQESAGGLPARCEEVLQIQAAGLKARLRHTGIQKAVIALSGGLDSTLALLAAARAFDRLGESRKGILCVSMPCFGTSERTRKNARALADAAGASFLEIPIEEAVEVHLREIGHPPAQQDTTYENAQARERTQVVMDLANQQGGLVVGTGDLSELALGFTTYNGDHMSMYAVNASIPKTLVRHLVEYEAGRAGEPLASVLRDILHTPVSPELLPPKEGRIAQKTEEIIGPYELHDFFLYYTLRFGFSPSKIFRLACAAFSTQYQGQEIARWMRLFYRRFFTQQFKRSCMPDGPKVGSVALSPRGDWRMPSDAARDLWEKELDALPADEQK